MSTKPETTLQSSMHTLEEYCNVVIMELERRGLAWQDLWDDYHDHTDSEDGPEIVHDLTNEALERLSGCGYANLEADDTLIIMPKDIDLPDEWLE